MVKIEAPQQDVVQGNTAPDNALHPQANHPQVKLGNAPVDSEAITEDGISSGMSDISDASAGEFKSGFASPPPIAGSHSSDPDLADRPLADQATLAGPPPAWQDNENWQSDKTRRTRHIVMIATIALSTLSVTVLTFGWFIRLQRSKSDQVAQSSENRAANIENAPSEAVQPGPADDRQAEDSGSPDQTNQPGLTPDPNEASTDEATSPDTVSESTAQTPAMAQETRQPQTIIPPSLIPTSPIQDDGDAVQNEDLPKLKELPAGLQQYVPMLFPESPAEETSLNTPPTINQVEIDAAAEDDSSTLGIKPPKPINLKRDLGFKVYFNSESYPLPSLLLLISEMTGVPIQIDWTSFDLAGVDVAKPIKVVGNPRTCRAWLDTIADQVGAEVREKEFVIVITLTDQTFAKAKTDLLNLDDFADGAKSAAQLIQEFMGPEKQAVQQALEAVGEDERPEPPVLVDVMQARERAQLEILVTEMLRRVRSIQPRLSDDRSSRWMQIGNDRFAQWQPIGDVDPAKLKPGSQPDTPITTAAMLRKISTINDSVCFVNWYDANQRGMRPTRLVMPNASQLNAAKMLSSVLGPLSMEVRLVDQHHWWVGSNATYDRLPVLVHSSPLGKRREGYVRQVDKIMSADPNGVYQSAYDPVSDRMLMLLPRYVARQLSKISKELAKR